MGIIKVNSEISLTPFLLTDSENLARYLNDRSVYENMLTIPYPYTLDDAHWFLNKVCSEQESGINEYKAVRMKNELIGGAGFKLAFGKDSHKDEIAYWLAEPFRNKGIMTEVVKKLCKDAFHKRNLERIEAATFDFNNISPKILEKSGFKFEGILRNYYKKDGNVFNGRMYSLIKEDLPNC